MLAQKGYLVFSEAKNDSDQTLQHVWFSQKFVVEGYILVISCCVSHSSNFLGFVRVDDKMLWQVPLNLFSGFVQFNLLDFLEITSS